MRGLIYKNIKLSITAPKINFLIAIFSIGITFIKISPVIGSLFFSFAVSTISTYSFYPEYKCGWNRYENILPVKKWKVIAGKYLTCLLFVLISVSGGIVINIIYSLMVQTYSIDIIALSLGIAIAFPLVWGSIFLPAVFKSGIQSVTYFRLLLIPVLLILNKYMEANITLSNTLIIPGLVLICLIIFIVSFCVSISITGKRL